MIKSIPAFLANTARRLPDKAAIVSPHRSVTFSELHQEAAATAECLRELGIQPGDRVGICMEKSVDQVSAILGALCANAVVVPILPRLKQANIRHIIENSGMVAMIRRKSAGVALRVASNVSSRRRHGLRLRRERRRCC